MVIREGGFIPDPSVFAQEWGVYAFVENLSRFRLRTPAVSSPRDLKPLCIRNAPTEVPPPSPSSPSTRVVSPPTSGDGHTFVATPSPCESLSGTAEGARAEAGPGGQPRDRACRGWGHGAGLWVFVYSSRARIIDHLSPGRGGGGKWVVTSFFSFLIDLTPPPGGRTKTTRQIRPDRNPLTNSQRDFLWLTE